MYILATSPAGKVSTKDNANTWRKGKDASRRCRYNQVHLFLPRACCHYSFLSHANVQISLTLVKAHGVLEDTVPILKTQRVWEHSSNGMDAFPWQGPGTQQPHLPRSPLGALGCNFFLLPGKLVENATGFGGGWAGGCGRGWPGAHGDTWTADRPECCWSASPKAARCLVPTGLASPLLPRRRR